jgi:hypothetical protein
MNANFNVSHLHWSSKERFDIPGYMRSIKILNRQGNT